MPARKTPTAKALVEGRHLVHPERHSARNALALPPLGEPPEWMNDPQADAWRRFEAELPWLDQSHRALVEIASTLATRMRTGADMGVQAMNTLRLCLGQMGATPTDQAKVAWPVGDEERDDLLD